MKTFFNKLSIYGLVLILLILVSFTFNYFIIYSNDLLSLENSPNKLIIGDSRTACAIDDKVLEKSINISGNGDALFFSMVKTRIFKINNQRIDTLILGLDNRTLSLKKEKRFYRSNSLEEKLPSYYNFITLSEWKLLTKIELYSSFKSILFIPKQSLRLAKKSLFKINGNLKIIGIGGYDHVTKTINQSIIDDFIKNDSYNNYSFSNIEIDNLYRIVEFCNFNNIELIFVSTPIHQVMYNSREYKEGKTIFENFLKENFPSNAYLDFSNHFLPDSCYADLVHLNFKGAEIFSKNLDSLLKIQNKLKTLPVLK